MILDQLRLLSFGSYTMLLVGGASPKMETLIQNIGPEML
jgi:hypothetical protein